MPNDVNTMAAEDERLEDEDSIVDDDGEEGDTYDVMKATRTSSITSQN